MSTEPPAEYGLVIPFVACASKGGPYDDDAFVAGYQAGRIDNALSVARTVGTTGLKATAATSLVRQLDLIAMHHGFQAKAEACEGAEGWSFITFSRETP